MYSIKLFKHNSVRANIDDDIAKIAPYFKSDFVKSIIPNGIDVSIVSEKTKVPKQDVYDKLIIPNKGKFDCIMYIFEKGKFPLGQDGWGYSLNFAGNTQAIHLMSNIASDNVDYTWKSMVHEILHCITYNLLQKNKISYDESWNLLDNPILDGKVSPYFGNENPYLVGGNHYQQLVKIAQFFPKVVTLTREYTDRKQTTGTLKVGDWTCKTLELPWLNNQKNISCIPKGTYLCKYTLSPKFLKKTYEVLGVSNRSGIRIHSANYFFQLNGCIALGSALTDINRDGEKDTINSRATIKLFEEKMGYKDFYLTIQ